MANNRHEFTTSYFRKVVNFLSTAKPGMYHQKAVDLSMPAALPQHIVLQRARGVEEVIEDEKDDSEDDSEEDDSEGAASSKHNMNIGNFGDFE